MIVHPRCACTRASVGELARVKARQGREVPATVLFVRPDGRPPEWAETDLVRSAAAIPGVTVMADPGGREARRFGTVTSGQVLLYDAAGALRFSGGITGGRGHAGDNPGRSPLERRLEGGAAAPAAAPVFGCGLFDAHASRHAAAADSCCN